MTSPSPAAEDLADRDLLAAAAREAGPLVLSFFRRPIESRSKGAAGPVTEADLAANAMLKQRLLEARPDYGWLSEEEPIDDPARLERRRAFVVDPLDGTRAFLDGEEDFCVALAVVEAGSARAAAIFAPAHDALYDAAAAAGARRNGAPIRACARVELEGALLGGEPRLYRDPRWPKPWPAIASRHVHALAYRLALVAAGDLDGMVALGPKHDWDVAAGALLVAEAGGRATDPWGAPLRFNRLRPATPGVVAAGAALHGLLIERTREVPRPADFPEQG